MRDDLQIRVARLKQSLAECPVPAGVSDEIKHILTTAPRMLGDIDRTIQSGNPSAIQQLAARIDYIETTIQWAVGTAKGANIAEAIASGREADAAIPPEQRLLNRITRFLSTKMDGPQLAALAREFAGEEAVQGNRIHMDPGGETEAFSQWLIHDIVLPDAPGRLIEWFAEEEGCNLPEDEEPILDARLRDRPSVYKVIELANERGTHTRKATYSVQDMLAPDDAIRITDRATSRTLQNGSVFMGRAIPVDRDHRRYQLLGSITKLPTALWARLAGIVDRWKMEFLDQHPDATTVDFYRRYHARLVRKIADLSGTHSSPYH